MVMLPQGDYWAGSDNVVTGNLGMSPNWTYSTSATVPSTRYEGATLKNLVTTKTK